LDVLTHERERERETMTDPLTFLHLVLPLFLIPRKVIARPVDVLEDDVKPQSTL